LKGQPYLYGLIVLMIGFWSANFIIAKVALREFPPLLLTGVRTTIAGAVMLLFRASRGADHRFLLSARPEVIQLVTLGLIGVALNQLFFVVGLGNTTVAHASIIVSMGPILVLLIGAAIKQEKLTRGKLAGMVLAVGGICLLNAIQEQTGTARATWFGDLFIFLSTLAFAFFTVFGKPLTRQYNSSTMTMVAYVGGAIALAPVTIWQSSLHPLSRISLTGWICALYMGLFPSVLAYLIYYYALTHIAPSRLAAFSYLQPVFATVLALMLLGEHLTAPVVTAGAVILTGVYVTERC
jgi:drug/metabolite transporter (DMT)-like permease